MMCSRVSSSVLKECETTARQSLLPMSQSIYTYIYIYIHTYIMAKEISVLLAWPRHASTVHDTQWTVFGTTVITRFWSNGSCFLQYFFRWSQCNYNYFFAVIFCHKRLTFAVISCGNYLNVFSRPSIVFNLVAAHEQCPVWTVYTTFFKVIR
jgi:hypothetical protein